MADIERQKKVVEYYENIMRYIMRKKGDVDKLNAMAKALGRCLVDDIANLRGKENEKKSISKQGVS